ncbi:hypothetical protein N665_0133s0008 [Sinapis alba]|nr:hypothetical protein N665_0133s0008 [Sinapis alba]
MFSAISNDFFNLYFHRSGEEHISGRDEPIRGRGGGESEAGAEVSRTVISRVVLG